MEKQIKKERHILALSGGKDSAALAVYLMDKIPNLEYVFTDSGCELPETYDYLEKLQSVLGINIVQIKSKKNFDYWLKYFDGVLPSPQNRWCTRLLKLHPYEEYIGTDKAYSYIAIRADEDREGYISTNTNIIPKYPFVENGNTKSDIIEILQNANLGLPDYYNWRSRSGCYFCFYQSIEEWRGLAKHHNNLFLKACEYEMNHSDDRTYTWRQNTLLKDLISEDTTLRTYPPNKMKRSKRDKFHEKLINIDFTISSNSILNLK